MTEQMIVPKLRFGDFEGKWEHHSIKDVLTSLVDCEHKTAPYVDAQDYMVVRTNNVKNGSLLMDDMKFTSEDGFREWTKRAVPTYGDILFTREAPAGESCLVPNNTKLCLGQRMVLLRIDQGSKSTIFISHLLLSPKVQNKINSYCIGSTVTRINIADINRIDFDIPSYEEQQKIASFLSKVDEKIGLLSDKKDKLTEYKRGVMQQLFNGKWNEQDGQLTFVPPTLRFKADDGSEFPDWGEKTIGNLGRVVTGSTPKTSEADNYGSDKMFISPADLDGKKFIHSTKTLVTQKGFESGRIIPKESICFVCIGSTIGKIALNANEAITNQQINSIIVEGSKFVSGFVFAALEKEAKKIKKLAGEQAVPIINKSEFSKYKLLVPTKAEQTHIANFLSLIDKKIDLANSELNKAKEWKKGLLQQMFV